MIRNDHKYIKQRLDRLENTVLIAYKLQLSIAYLFFNHYCLISSFSNSSFLCPHTHTNHSTPDAHARGNNYRSNCDYHG